MDQSNLISKAKIDAYIKADVNDKELVTGGPLVMNEGG